MKRILLASTALAALATAVPAHAALVTDPTIDPLHGFCTGCADDNLNGSTVTTLVAPPGFTGSGFGFTVSPPVTGTHEFELVFAVPTNETQPTGGKIPVTGTVNGLPVVQTDHAGSIGVFGPSPTQDISDVIGTTLTGGMSPTNPFSNFIGFTDKVDPGAVSYDLYIDDLGTISLLSPGAATTIAQELAAMDLSASLPVGSMIFGFFKDQPTPHAAWAATASSGVLFVDDAACTVNCGRDPRSVPEPGSMGLLTLGLGLLATGLYSRRS